MPAGLRAVLRSRPLERRAVSAAALELLAAAPPEEWPEEWAEELDALDYLDELELLTAEAVADFRADPRRNVGAALGAGELLAEAWPLIRPRRWKEWIADVGEGLTRRESLDWMSLYLLSPSPADVLARGGIRKTLALRPPYGVDAADVLAHVGDFYRLDPAELAGRERRYDHAYPRYVLSYVLAEGLGYPPSGVGRMLDGRGDSVILKGCAQVREWVATDKAIRAEVRELLAAFPLGAVRPAPPNLDDLRRESERDRHRRRREQRRAAESREEREARLAIHAARERQRRVDHGDAIRQRDRERRAAESPEEREARLARTRESRAVHRDEYLARERERRAAESPEEREARLAQKREHYYAHRDAIRQRVRERLAAESPEEREARLARDRERRAVHRDEYLARQRERRAAESPEEREARLAWDRERRAVHRESLRERQRARYWEHRDEMRQKAKEYRERNKDEVKRRRDERLAAESPEEREARLARKRANARKHADKTNERKRAERAADPAKAEAHRQRTRDYVERIGRDVINQRWRESARKRREAKAANSANGRTIPPRQLRLC